MAKRKLNDLFAKKMKIISGLLSKYDIKTVENIQETLKDFFAKTIKNIMEAKMSEHLDYKRSQRHLMYADRFSK